MLQWKDTRLVNVLVRHIFVRNFQESSIKITNIIFAIVILILGRIISLLLLIIASSKLYATKIRMDSRLFFETGTKGIEESRGERDKPPAIVLTLLLRESACKYASSYKRVLYLFIIGFRLKTRRGEIGARQKAGKKAAAGFGTKIMRANIISTGRFIE